MRLTSKGRYALQALLDLAQQVEGTPVKSRDVAARQNLPANYLEQLFRKLRMARILKSMRGPGGGYLLGLSTDQITIKAVLDSVEDAEEDLYKSDTLESKIMHQFLDIEFSEFSASFFSQRTLADVLKLLDTTPATLIKISGE